MAIPKESVLNRFILELRSEVFDPFYGGLVEKEKDSIINPPENRPGNNGETLPVSMPEREYWQRVYWVRDKFLAIETFSADGEELHFYLDEKFKPISVGLSDNRRFSGWDILHPYLPFVETTSTGWLMGAMNWGVLPSKVELVRTFKGAVYYRLSETPGKSLWIERNKMRPIKIETVISGFKNPMALTLEFSEFMVFSISSEEEKKEVVFPRTVNFLLNGNLFKQTTIRKMEVNPSWRAFPLTRLREKARELGGQTSPLKLTEGRS